MEHVINTMKVEMRARDSCLELTAQHFTLCL